jgi:hypothetical protein
MQTAFIRTRVTTDCQRSLSQHGRLSDRLKLDMSLTRQRRSRYNRILLHTYQVTAPTATALLIPQRNMACIQGH